MNRSQRTVARCSILAERDKYTSMDVAANNEDMMRVENKKKKRKQKRTTRDIECGLSDGQRASDAAEQGTQVGVWDRSLRIPA